jgi:acyl-CoA synthetase (NDP forming)
VVASIVGADGRLPSLAGPSVPNFVFPESCAGVLGRAVERREWLSRPLGERRLIERSDPSTDGLIASCVERSGADSCWLSGAEGAALLRSYGIAFEPAIACPSVDDAVVAAARVDGPIALKAVLAPPQNASDIDAVLLGLEGESAVRAGWRELAHRVSLCGRTWRGALVQPLIGPGADVLVGALTDPDLGPVMGLGLGGRQAGLGEGAAFSVVPSTDVEAEELIAAAEGVVRQLDGFRGAARLDRDALRELVLRFGLLLRNVPELNEIDLNPVRCMPSGCVVLDARIRIDARHVPVRIKTW